MSEYNASDTKQIRAAAKRSKTEQAMDDGVLLMLMSTQNGRAWMLRLLTWCGISRTPFTGDGDATNFNCGMQNVGLRLEADLLRACPDQFIFMMREANDGGRTSSDTDPGQQRDQQDSGWDDSAPDGRVERDSDPDSGPGDATVQ